MAKKDERKRQQDLDALELDPEVVEDEELDTNELVIPSGDGYYWQGNSKYRNFW